MSDVRDREFLRLWMGQAVSVFGSGVTQSALPLAAVLLLGANAADMGWLLAAESAPVLALDCQAVLLERNESALRPDLHDVGHRLHVVALAVVGVFTRHALEAFGGAQSLRHRLAVGGTGATDRILSSSTVS